MKYNNAVLKIAIREYKRIIERKTLFVLSIVLPIFIFLFFALLYKNEIIYNVPIGVLDLDNSETSLLITRYIDATSYIKVADQYYDIEDVKRDIRKGIIQGAVYIPHGTEKNLKAGKPVFVTIYKNTANLVIGNLIYKDAMTVIKSISGGVLLKKLKAKGIHPDKAYNIMQPIKVETKSLYNPNYSYLNYLVPGLLACMLQMIIMLSGVLIISSEFVHETFGELINLAQNKVWVIIIGKSLPHIAFHFVTAILIIGVIFPIFNVTIAGATFNLLLLFLIFILASFFFAFMISSLFHDQMFATELALFINTPAFLFSGFTFPLAAMPLLHNIFASIIPFTHFLYAYLMIYQMGTPLSYASSFIFKLSLFIIIPIIVIIFSLKHHIKTELQKQNG